MAVETKVGPVTVKLVDNVANWWKFWSIRFGALAVALMSSLVAIQAMPGQELFPLWFKQCLAIGGAVSTVLGGIARVLAQPPPASNDPSTGA